MSQRTERDTTSVILQRTWGPAAPGSASAERGTSTTPSATYRELRVQGLAADEAGNLTAYLNGIRPVEGGWTVGEIDRLLFMRHLIMRGSYDAYAAS